MKKIVAFCLLCFSSSILLSQNHKIDSLKNALKASNEDSNKVNTGVKLAVEFYKIGDYPAALQQTL